MAGAAPSAGGVDSADRRVSPIGTITHQVLVAEGLVARRCILVVLCWRASGMQSICKNNVNCLWKAGELDENEKLFRSTSCIAWPWGAVAVMSELSALKSGTYRRKLPT